jgi:hypothetical protein
MVVSVASNHRDGLRLETEAQKAPLRQYLRAYRFWRAAHDSGVRRAYVKAAIARIDHFYRRPTPALSDRLLRGWRRPPSRPALQ